jgi:hypothetical protein
MHLVLIGNDSRWRSFALGEGGRAVIGRMRPESAEYSGDTHLVTGGADATVSRLHAIGVRSGEQLHVSRFADAKHPLADADGRQPVPDHVVLRPGDALRLSPTGSLVLHWVRHPVQVRGVSQELRTAAHLFGDRIMGEHLLRQQLVALDSHLPGALAGSRSTQDLLSRMAGFLRRHLPGGGCRSVSFLTCCASAPGSVGALARDVADSGAECGGGGFLGEDLHAHDAFSTGDARYLAPIAGWEDAAAEGSLTDEADWTLSLPLGLWRNSEFRPLPYSGGEVFCVAECAGTSCGPALALPFLRLVCSVASSLLWPEGGEDMH